MNYLESMSKRLDTLAVDNSNFGSGGREIPKRAYDRLLSDEEQERIALQSYIRNVQKFYTTDIIDQAEEKRQAILRTLSFSQLHDRELAIPEAHRRTFEWIFDSDPNTKTNFVEWLRSENGIFWIKGKAGSGKSTLMKFITEHATADRHLRRWAGLTGPRENLVTARYYFWSPGVPIQKSQEGLLRSLLLQILSKCPYLIEKVCEDRWSTAYAESFTPWTWPSLLEAMITLSQQKASAKSPGAAPGSSLKICLFIDGLDEYEGDHTELINVLFQISKSPNVKICTSSRPWLEFSDAFDSSPWKICMHDLTLPDICQYVQDNLGGDEKFKRLQTRSRDMASEIVNSIVSRSEGVFLWVFLVVRSLLRGLRNEDNLSTLQQRLNALPSDLEKFFERILDSVEDIYRERAARLFLTLSYARRSFPVFTFLFFNFGNQSAAAQAEELGFLSQWPAVDSALLEVLMTKKRQLIAQCKDMIHIAPDSNAPLLFGEKVSFLHRTIVDYIHTDQTSAYLQRLAGDFDPRILLFDAYLGQSRALMSQHRLTYVKPQLRQWVLAILFYASEVEIASSGPCELVNLGLDELEGIILQAFRLWDFSEGAFTILGEKYLSLIHIAVRCDLAGYVHHRLPQCTAATLDEVAPGWREPCLQIVQVSDFTMRQTLGTHATPWRLGHTTGIVQSITQPENSHANRDLDQSPTPQNQEASGDTSDFWKPIRPRRRSVLLRRVVNIFR